MEASNPTNTIPHTRPVTLKQLFEGDSLVEDCEQGQTPANPTPRSIEIPRIQRSYAQGRENDHAERTRTRFLNAIYDRLAKSIPMTLDFVYGNISDNKLIPLDGQQRLTTVFLLHWYASCFNTEARQHVMFKDEAFNYMTRYSSRDFLKRLMCFTPAFETDNDNNPTNKIQGTISKQIKEEQGWFLVEWSKDPSIASMLVMLDAIDNKFGDVADRLWNMLDNIYFYVLDVTSMNQTDDIYVRMNSRGRQLTDFEHFKAELLRRISESTCNTHSLSDKIDGTWADMLWPLSQDTKTIDTRFLRLFRFVSMVITYRRGGSFSSKISEFDLVEKFFSISGNGGTLQNTTVSPKVAVQESIDLLTKVMDGWHSMGDIQSFFEEYIVNEAQGHTPGKILDRGLRSNPFASWVNSQTDSLHLFTFLYAFTVVIEKKPELLGSEDFRRRLRIISNLIKNSTANEIVDSATDRSHAGNRMPDILKQVDSIMLNGKVINDKSIGANFLGDVVSEEEDKLAYTSTLSPEGQDEIFKLEDNKILDGRIKVVDFRRPSRFDTFHILFDTSVISRSTLEKALLAHGDYTVVASGADRYIGTGKEGSDEEWKSILREMTKTRNANALTVFQDFLDVNVSPTLSTLQNNVDEYLNDCIANNRFEWRYYYIKYPAFRRERYGFISLDYTRPYEMVTHYTKQKASVNSEQPFLKSVLGTDYTYDYSGRDGFNQAHFNSGFLSCMNDAWLFRSSEGVFTKKIDIPQDDNGVDTIDRIELFRSIDKEELEVEADNNEHP